MNTLSENRSKSKVISAKSRLKSCLKGSQAGNKQKINEKEMRKLASKNYEKLPEVVKMKEQQKKKEEIKARMNRAKEFDKKLKGELLKKV
mmetsp:Transcript_38792/g.44391  ORF Transcript_38792/g.44391 Transcript_38792/m.44391 type:complete len:90 (+) Transcript_38792:97-366(+)